MDVDLAAARDTLRELEAQLARMEATSIAIGTTADGHGASGGGKDGRAAGGRYGGEGGVNGEGAHEGGERVGEGSGERSGEAPPIGIEAAHAAARRLSRAIEGVATLNTIGETLREHRTQLGTIWWDCQAERFRSDGSFVRAMATTAAELVERTPLLQRTQLCEGVVAAAAALEHDLRYVGR